MKPFQFEINCSLWKSSLLVFVGFKYSDAIKEYYKRIQKQSSNELIEECIELDEKDSMLGNYYSAGNRNGFIWLKAVDVDIGIIAHEVFHYTFHILDSAGITLTQSSEEVFAYMLDDYVSRIYSVIQSEKELQNKDKKMTTKKNKR